MDAAAVNTAVQTINSFSSKLSTLEATKILLRTVRHGNARQNTRTPKLTYIHTCTKSCIHMWECLPLSKASNDEIKKNRFPIASSRMFICLWICIFKYLCAYVGMGFHMCTCERNHTFRIFCLTFPSSFRHVQCTECPKTTANQSKFARDDLPWNFWSMYNTPIFQLRQIDLLRGRLCLTTAFKYVPASAAAAGKNNYKVLSTRFGIYVYHLGCNNICAVITTSIKQIKKFWSL